MHLDQALSYLRSSPSLLSAFFSNPTTTPSSSSSSSSTRTPPQPDTPTQQWLRYLETYLLTPLFTYLPSLNPLSDPQKASNNRTASKSAGSGSNSGADVLTTILVLAALFVVFRIANYIRRLVVWWTVFLIKIVVLYGVLVVGWSVWSRGLERTVRDVAMVWGFVEGVVEWVGREFGAVGGARGYDARGPAGRSGYGSGYGYGGGRGQVPMGTRRGGWV